MWVIVCKFCGFYDWYALYIKWVQILINSYFKYMTYKFEGSKYRNVENKSLVEIAKLIRKDLKLAYPDFKFSISVLDHIKINIIITKTNNIEVFNTAYQKYKQDKYTSLNLRDWINADNALITGEEFELVKNYFNLTKEAHAIKKNIEFIANEYNFDDSEIESDYTHNNFYLSVKYDNL